MSQPPGPNERAIWGIMQHDGIRPAPPAIPSSEEADPNSICTEPQFATETGRAPLVQIAAHHPPVDLVSIAEGSQRVVRHAPAAVMKFKSRADGGMTVNLAVDERLHQQQVNDP